MPRHPHRALGSALAGLSLLGLVLVLALPAAAMVDPLQPASSGGLAALDRALARLATHQRLLIIAAHPDDEDTALLTYVSRGLGGEAAYLSLSRGEGGQNLIGPELGVGLGLLRSRELLAARGIDGARQFFSRAYDFGYTRSVDETLARWPEAVLLEDAVRVIRRFQPQIVVAIFPPDERAGHGQHQASGQVARQAFELAADPAAFPQLTAEGWAPWAALAFYRAAWWNPEAANSTFPLGGLDPFAGRSIFQIALASRSQHRCQDMGLVQPLGDAEGRLVWEAGEVGEDGAGLFAGIDTGLAAIADPLPAGALRDGVAMRLARVQTLAAGARRDLTPLASQQAVGPLLEIVELLNAVEASLMEAPDAAAHAAAQVRRIVVEKREIAEEAAADAAGVLADAIRDECEGPACETVVIGGTFAVRSLFWNAGERSVEALAVTVHSPAGWQARGEAAAEPAQGRFATRLSDERRLEVAVPADAGPTVPYFLTHPLDGDLYDWSTADPAVKGLPFAPPPLSLRFQFRLDGVPVTLDREVVYRYRDQAAGEVRRPLRAVPVLEVTASPELVIWPLGRQSMHTLQVEVRSHLEAPVKAWLEMEAPAGWPPMEALAVEIDEPQGRFVAELTIRAPDDLTPGRHPLRVVARTADGKRYDQAVQLVDYSHIRPTPLPAAARVEISAARIDLPPLERVGYVRGASDLVPEFLAQAGLPIEILDGTRLAAADFTAYDAIIIGSRAYEIDPALVRANPRLLDYVRDGGLLIVQYHKYPFNTGGYAPLPLTIGRPNPRVTDETAPVRLLVPEHPVFHTPNVIGDEDWAGWVQERGLYFAGEWDDAYQPLLAMADPGGEELRGALLVAELGAGHYVYTGLAFFRQLPAGVPGAYRLLANLLGLAERQPQ